VFGLGGLEFVGQALALFVGGEHGVEQRDRGRRVLLVHRRDAGVLRIADLPVAGVKLVEDQLEQRGFAHAVAADETHMGAHGNADGRVVKKPAAPGVECQVIDLQHGERGGLSEAGA
jgi:hypothetical protein